MRCGKWKRRSDEAGLCSKASSEMDSASPLRRMKVEERLVADYHGTGLTTGPHPMAYRRNVFAGTGSQVGHRVKESSSRKRSYGGRLCDYAPASGNSQGDHLHDAGRRNGNFTGDYQPDFYDKNRMAVLNERFVLVSGVVQNQDHVVHLKARSIERLTISAANTPSHDFH